MTRNARHAVIFLVLMALMLATQFSLASQRSFWEDEAVTARLSGRSFSDIVTDRARDNHPPLYWLLVRVWAGIFGTDEIGLRSFSILCLAGVLGLVYKLADMMFGPRAAWQAGVLLVVSPYMLSYGYNARYYAFAASLSLLALLAAYLYVEKRKLWALGLIILAGIALFYTVYMGTTVVLAINLWFLVQLLRRKTSFRQVTAWLLAQGLILLGTLPWLGFLAGAAERNLDPAFDLASLPAASALRLGYLGFAYSVGEFFSPLHPLVWLGILLSLFLLLSALRRLDASSGLLISVLGVVVLASVLVSSATIFPQSAWQNLSNRTFFIFPGFVLLLAAGLDRMPSRRAMVTLGLLLGIYLVGAYNVFTARQAVKPLLIVPWVEVMEKIQTESQPGAIVFCSQFDTVCPYYVDRFGLQRSALGEWEKTLASRPAEVWWLQNNIGGYAYARDVEQAAFQALQAGYPQMTRFDYTAQDVSIRVIKARWLGQEDYPYRLNLYKFNQHSP